jgi:hypothetical protein
VFGYSVLGYIYCFGTWWKIYEKLEKFPQRKIYGNEGINQIIVLENKQREFFLICGSKQQ